MSDTQQAEVVDEAGQTGVVEVDALLTHDLDHIWHVLSTNDGAAAFLGEGARLGSKGEQWHAADGSHGVWRSYHPMEQVRVSWHADQDAPRSLVDVHLAPEGEHTRVTIRHEPVAGDLAAMRARWEAALERIDAAAGD
ncbi:MAG TPA: SRPBCC domain-containing protein [Dermatophilaceae bacterium]|nr:SRPBCC domain-containing protein [Dermatophilaceae bacterium]